MAEVALFAYACCNSLSRVFHVLQIVGIAQDREGAMAILLATWGLWVAANGATVLNAWVNLSDMPLVLQNVSNTVACMIAMALRVWKRRRFSTTDTQPSFRASAASLSGRLAE